MTVGIKDGIKLAGVAVMCMCAVFVNTVFLNFSADVLPLGGIVPPETRALYDAQLVTARLASVLSGVFLTAVAIVMTCFYIKLYIDDHAQRLGVLKAMGYSNGRLALGFACFGLSVLVGCAIGYAAGWILMPTVYDSMHIDGLPEIPIEFHAHLAVCLVVVPPVVFAAIAVLYACVQLRRPVCEMLRGSRKTEAVAKGKAVEKGGRFLSEMGLSAMRSQKTLVFFVCFACFCFSSMVQMGLSMKNLSSDAMGIFIAAIGLTLAAAAMIMACTALVNRNAKSIAVMKIFGYSVKECAIALFAWYIPFAFSGFAIGTVYQYGLLKIIMTFMFKDVAVLPEYGFDVSAFFIALATFVAAYALFMIYYAFKIRGISVKKIMIGE